jgi:hypothetical protein
MEDILHLTSKRNIKSILKHGILPTPIKLEHHWETFKEHGLKQKKCIYTWNGETYNNSKFIRDMVYTKLFIHPRNDLYDYTDDEIDMSAFGKTLYGTDETYYLLNIKTFEGWLGNWTHVQEPGEGRAMTTHMMADQYAHNDKLLEIYKSIIKPENIEILETVNTRVYKNHTIGFSFHKFGKSK